MVALHDKIFLSVIRIDSSLPKLSVCSLCCTTHQSDVSSVRFIFWFSVGYPDYTDAYSREEIEMMKTLDEAQVNTGGGSGTPHNWYLLYLSGKTGLQSVHNLLCVVLIKPPVIN